MELTIQNKYHLNSIEQFNNTIEELRQKESIALQKLEIQELKFNTIISELQINEKKLVTSIQELEERQKRENEIVNQDFKKKEQEIILPQWMPDLENIKPWTLSYETKTIQILHPYDVWSEDRRTKLINVRFEGQTKDGVPNGLAFLYYKCDNEILSFYGQCSFYNGQIHAAPALFVDQNCQTRFYSYYENGRRAQCQFITYCQFKFINSITSASETIDASGWQFQIGQYNNKFQKTGVWKLYENKQIYTDQWKEGQFISGEGRLLQQDGTYKVFKSIKDTQLGQEFIRVEPKQFMSIPAHATNKVWRQETAFPFVIKNFFSE